MLYVGKGSKREQCRLFCSLPDFSHSLLYPQSNWAPLVLVPEWVGLCTPQAPVGFSNDLSCDAGSLLLLPQHPRAFSIRGLRLYFPEAEPWVAWSASLPAVCPVYLCANVGPRGATRRSACPVLRHSESGPLGLSVRMWGRRACQRSDCLPLLSHIPLVSVPPQQSESSPPWLPVRLCPSYRSG